MILESEVRSTELSQVYAFSSGGDVEKWAHEIEDFVYERPGSSDVLFEDLRAGLDKVKEWKAREERDALSAHNKGSFHSILSSTRLLFRCSLLF